MESAITWHLVVWTRPHARRCENSRCCRGVRVCELHSFPGCFRESHGAIPLEERESRTFRSGLVRAGHSRISPRPFLYVRSWSARKSAKGPNLNVFFHVTTLYFSYEVLLPSFPDASKIVFRSLETSPAATFLRADDSSMGMASLRSAVKEAACSAQVGDPFG